MTLTIYLNNTEQVVTTYTGVDAVTIYKNGSVAFTRRIESQYSPRTETMNIDPTTNHIVIDRASDEQ